MNELVSIVTPAYNSENYIAATIESVLAQTYPHFEMLIVDDQSTDRTRDIIEMYQVRDPRIKYKKLEKKGGASMARNKAIRMAQGRYIAFLDADDLWDPQKLEVQLNFMRDHDYAFTYSSYRFIDESGESLERYRTSTKTTTLNRILFMSSTVGCLTAVYDRNKVGLIQIPKLNKRNDIAMWHRVLQTVEKGYYLDQTLASYRVVSDSLSHHTSKSELLKHHYTLYRKNLKFSHLKSWFYSLMNVFCYVIIKLKYEKRGPL